MVLISEFREFAVKGNVVDMAVGIIIGGALGGIVQSFIKDVVMPVIGMAGNVDFTNAYIPLAASVTEARDADPTLTLDAARAIGPVLAYGNFVTILLNFIILAFAIFLFIKAMNTAKRRFEKQQEEAAAAPAAPPEDVLLLREIRDALSKG